MMNRLKTFSESIGNRIWSYSPISKKTWRMLEWTIFITLMTWLHVGMRIDNIDKEREKISHERINCMNSICPNDTPPKPPHGMRTVKFNYTWYFIPENYFSCTNCFIFYWPHKSYYHKEKKYPGSTHLDDVYDVHITLFNPRTKRFINGMREDYFYYPNVIKKNNEGSMIMKIKYRKNLELWQFYGLMNGVIFIDTQKKTYYGHPPFVICETHRFGNTSCSGQFTLNNDISAYITIPSRIAPNWPEIYAEIDRFLQQVKKVKP